MENQTPSASEWTSTKVYLLSAICLLLGVALGALFHGPARTSPILTTSVASDQQIPAGAGQMPPGTPNPHAMVANVSSDPVFEKLKSDPNNFELLAQAGNVEMKGNDPKSAAGYYERALKVKNDLDIRTNLANAYFRAGDADRSLAELDMVLKVDPKNDKALYNTGVVKLMAKNDSKGAIAAWETFLKYHPDHPHKDQVQEMIKRVKSAKGNAQG
jgi:cytochrome c-type biogenesis protein CcmH/NrfG